MVLFPLIRHLDRVHQLVPFADIRVIITDDDIFHVLLGNSGATTCADVSGELPPGSAQEARNRKSAVIPEIPVFGGQDCVRHVVRQVFQRNEGAVTFWWNQPGKLRTAVGSINMRDLSGGDLTRFRGISIDVCNRKNHAGDCQNCDEDDRKRDPNLLAPGARLPGVVGVSLGVLSHRQTSVIAL